MSTIDPDLQARLETVTDRCASLIAKLKKQRIERGISEEQMAEYLGCSAEHLHAIENASEDPGLLWVLMYAEIIGVRLEATDPQPFAA